VNRANFQTRLSIWAQAPYRDVRFAFASLRRNPLLSVLIVMALAVGLAAATVTLAMYHCRAGDPIPLKSSSLFAVALDLFPSGPAPQSSGNGNPPFQLSYRDARGLYKSNIPNRSAIMFKSRGLVVGNGLSTRPLDLPIRVTTADFFEMFDVPFKNGRGWRRSDDEAPEPVVVLSSHASQLLFGSSSAIGKSVEIGGIAFRVIGVLNTWMPRPKFYDLNSSAFDLPEDLFVPFGWGEVLKLQAAGNLGCLGANVSLNSYDDLLTSDCVWLQQWVELTTSAQREKFKDFVDAYVLEQKRIGRFPRPLNNRVSDVSEWLEMNNVVGDESRLQLILAGVFLVVCALNSMGLILAKFYRSLSIAALRRAIGASKLDIFREHLVEATIFGVVAGVVGLVLARIGLELIFNFQYAPIVRTWGNPDQEALFRSLLSIDVSVVLSVFAISVAAGVLAGLYPAWRVGVRNLSAFLKVA
jgi:putative ABC transport system permease protein